MKESLVAEVDAEGGVTVEGAFVGRLEGFRFRMDKAGSPDEARTLRQAATEALRPEFLLRADRFYNAPDTELDYTEQGGLMWGTTAVGKLVKGADALKPLVEPFVDEEAGDAVADKVRRRLQHFIDRKVAALFEPLHALAGDENLAGLARGFAFRLVEAMGILPREGVAEEVKALDQDARGALRKHGVRFGQYTIFLPQLLKPAPTRLRMVLWSLWEGLQEFPESPPPGLVTIPVIADVPRRHYTLAGYRPAGQRAIRIDMLERLADIIRGKDSRAGFEATPEMLSITGLTLPQFADLMGGLGYRATQGERPRVRAAAAAGGPKDIVAEPALPDAAPSLGTEGGAEGAAPDPADDASPRAAGAAPPVAGADAPAPPAAPVETEVFYTFVWAPRHRGPRRDGQLRDGQNRDGQPREGRKRDGQRRDGQRHDGQRHDGHRHAGEGRDRSQGERRALAAAQPAADTPAPPPRPERDRAERDRAERDRAERDHPERDRPAQARHGGPQKDGGARRPGDKPAGGPNGGKDARRDQGGVRAEARPPRSGGSYDPDSPFAILAALRDRT
jgi:ATP-dependent RNA helicase SUPV3L1/SUV3